MKLRAIGGVLTAITGGATLTAAVLSGQPFDTVGPNMRVWYGTIDAREVLFNVHDETPAHRPVRYFTDVFVEYSFVSVDDPTHPSGIRWIVRRITWRGRGFSASSITEADCVGEGYLDLGPAQGYDQLTDAQHERLRIPCKFTDKAINWAIIPIPNPKVRLPIIDTNMPACTPTRRWTDNEGVHYSLTVVGGDLKGGFRVGSLDTAPVPGGKYKIAGWSNHLGRWKFVVESSRLRGFATNADVDPLFFRLYPAVEHFRERYRTLDPDMIFDPAHADPAVPGGPPSEWKPPYPDSGRRKWTVLESAPDTSVNRVEAELTAMDFGAHGEVRAFFSPSCLGAEGPSPDRWIPVPVENTAADTVVKVPTDDDGNFIADWGHTFDNDMRGVPALTDDDPEPEGDGTPGDGFTAFEEYRGFLVAEGCEGTPPLTAHRRTDPKKKDLFIRPSNSSGFLREIWEDFGFVSGLQVHPVCAPQYADDQTRVVNFTMHSISGPSALGEGLRGAQLTQARPQHGLYLVQEALRHGPLGMASALGPPRNVSRVSIDVRAILDLYGRDADRRLKYIGVHELGHAVGIRHHGEGDLTGPIVLLTTPGCIVGMTEGMVDGRPACLAEKIAIRHQQHSGNTSCPMRYFNGRWYVPRGSSLSYSRQVDFRPDTQWAWQRPTQLPGYDGRVERYRKDLDVVPPVHEMKFCTAQTGTGVNALPMDQNHAGDSSRPPCAGQLRVNDVPSGSPSGQ
jgi:hypothetical protein